MATDNVVLNVGTGGDVVRTLADADGKEWQAVVASYATTISAGENVLQVVDASHGLPVAQQGSWSVDATISDPVAVTQSGTWNVGISGTPTVTATQSGTWTVGIAESQAIAATQSGSWSVSLAGTPTVEIADAQTIAAVTSITNPVAVTQSGDWTFALDAVEVTQDTAEDLLATAYQGGTWTVDISSGQTIAATQSGTWTVGLSASQTLAAVTSITNPVTVAQGTASNLKATVDIASGQSVEVVQDTAADLKCTASQGGTWTVGLSSSQTLANVTTVGTITNPVGIAAGSNLVGKVSAGDDVTHLYDGATALTLKRAKATATSSGDTQVVAAVSSKSILVLRYALRFNSTVSATFKSGSTAISAPFYGVQYGVNSGAACKYGHYATAAGEALNLNLASSGTVAVEVLYVEV